MTLSLIYPHVSCDRSKKNWKEANTGKPSPPKQTPTDKRQDRTKSDKQTERKPRGPGHEDNGARPGQGRRKSRAGRSNGTERKNPQNKHLWKSSLEGRSVSRGTFEKRVTANLLCCVLAQRTLFGWRWYVSGPITGHQKTYLRRTLCTKSFRHL